MDSKKVSFLSKKRNTKVKILLTSLMDVLTIILVFLISHFTKNPESSFVVPEYVRLPVLREKNLSDNSFLVPVSISMNKIFVGKVGQGYLISFGDYRKERSKILLDYKKFLLKVKKSAEQDTVSAMSAFNPVRFKVSVLADKSIPYDLIDSLIFAGNEVGLNYYDFIIQRA